MATKAPTKDIDWFNQDSIYRGAAGNSLADLTSQLATLLGQRDTNNATINQSQDTISTGRQDDLTSLGNDVAARGIQSSGLYAQAADKTAASYAKQQAGLDLQKQNLAQQYGTPGSTVDLSGLSSAAKNGNANLSKVYGQLGQLGVAAGNTYNTAISAAKAASAARSAAPLVQTVKW